MSYNDSPDHINFEFSHSAASFVLKYDTSIDEMADNESFGIRDIYIFLGLSTAESFIYCEAG